MQIGKKHILLVTTSFPREIAGQEAAGGFVYDIARKLANRLSVTVVAPGSDNGQEQLEGISVYRYAAPEQAMSSLKLSSPKGFWFTVKVMWQGFRATRRALAHNTDITYIMAFWVVPSGLWAWLAGSGNGIPFSSWALGSDIWSYKNNPISRFILRRVLLKSDRCYADGFELCDQVESIAPVSCKMIPSARLDAHEIKAHKQAAAPYNLVFVGRWHVNKGVDLLLDALLELPDEDWSRIHSVCIAGGGPLEPLVRQKVEALQRHRRPVECRGYVGKKELYELLQWADFYLLPSRIESIPVILSDGVANRTPVIAMPVGDVKRLCEQFRLGWVASSVSVKDYSKVISAALNSKEPEPTMDAQGFFELLDQDRSIKEIIGLVNQGAC